MIETVSKTAQPDPGASDRTRALAQALGAIYDNNSTIHILHGGETYDVSFPAQTTSAMLAQHVRALLGLAAEAAAASEWGAATDPLLAVAVDARKPFKVTACQEDCFPLSRTVPNGSVLRLVSLREWRAMRSRRAQSRWAALRLAGLAGLAQPSQRPPRSFLKSSVRALTRCDPSLVPTVQCTVHLLSLSEVDPKTKTFVCKFNMMLDWIDERMATGASDLDADEINAVLEDPTLYLAPQLQMRNMTEGAEGAAVCVPRCDDSVKGVMKSTQQVFGRCSSGMCIQRFPLDSHLLAIETTLRSITLDKAQLEPGQGQRLFINFVDLSSQTLNKADFIKVRRHLIVPQALKVHAWGFEARAAAIAAARARLAPQRSELAAVQQRLRQRGWGEGHRADGSEHAEHGVLTAREAALCAELAAGEPRPEAVYQVEASEPAASLHVIGFRVARRAGTVMWTLALPIFVVTSLAFCQFGIDATRVGDRLEICLTTIFATLTFQHVVRRTVPSVPYRTVMDNFVIASFVIQSLLCLASTAVAVAMGSRDVSRSVSQRGGLGTLRPQGLVELLLRAAGVAPTSVGDGHAPCDAQCEAAQGWDWVAQWAVLAAWVAVCGGFAGYAMFLRFWKYSFLTTVPEHAYQPLSEQQQQQQGQEKQRQRPRSNPHRAQRRTLRHSFKA